MPRVPEIRRRRAPRAVPALLLAAMLAPAAAPGGAPAKALPPVSIMWQVDSTSGGADVHGIDLTVTARAPFPDLRVAIDLPPGVTPVAGETAWNGPLGRGASHTVSLAVRAPRPAAVHAKISGKTASNVHFSATVTIHVPEQRDKKGERPGKEPPAQNPTPGIREFRSP